MGMGRRIERVQNKTEVSRWNHNLMELERKKNTCQHVGMYLGDRRNQV